MCGIVGLYAKAPELEQELGSHLAAMLVQMSDRAPDSAGVALYREPAPPGSSKLTQSSAEPAEPWDALAGELAAAFGGAEVAGVRGSHAVLEVESGAEDAEVWIRRTRPELRVMSAGRVIEIYKEAVLPQVFADEYRLAEL